MDGEEAVEDVSPVLQSLETVADERFESVEGDAGEVREAALDVGTQVLNRVQLGRVRGQNEDLQPVPRTDQVTHGVGDMGVEPVPDQHDRRFDQLVDSVDQTDVVALGQAAALALAPGVAPQAVAQPGPRVRAHREQPGDRDPAGAPATDLHDRGDAAPSPGAPLRRPASESGFVLEADPSVAGCPGAFTSAQVASFQAATACSSRSAARRAGTCGVKPRGRIKRVAPETGPREPNAAAPPCFQTWCHW